MRTWSSYEDVRLLAGIYRYGIDNWAPISKFVGNGRTRAQCAQRWARGLNPRICKDTWDPSEDLRLMQLVQQYGDKSWTRIAASLGNRSDVQCRYHYHQITKDMNQMVQMPRPQVSSSTSTPAPPPPSSTPQIPTYPPQFQVQSHSQSPTAAFPAFTDAISTSSNPDLSQQQIPPLQNQPLIPRPFPLMRAPLRFSMPKINPSTPLFNTSSDSSMPPPIPPETQIQEEIDTYQTSFDNGVQQFLPKIVNHSYGTARRASHFVIPPIDPKFEMPMKVNPIRFEEIEKLDQQKFVERKSSFTSNIDDFLNKFQ